MHLAAIGRHRFWGGKRAFQPWLIANARDGTATFAAGKPSAAPPNCYCDILLWSATTVASGIDAMLCKGDSSEEYRITRGGDRVLIRAARPKDAALYSDFLADVSAEDLRLRFFARIAELSAAEADKVCHLDFRHEMAFIALDENTGRMLGLVRLKDELDEETAEFAILVRSRLKSHGLGWLLMRRVIGYAKEKGLRRVYGDVLTENTAMLQMCDELGFREEELGSDMKRVVLDLET